MQACCLQPVGQSTAPAQVPLPPLPPLRSALFQLLGSLPKAVKARLAAIAIDGTSATALLVDGETGRVLAAPKMYDEAQSPEVVQRAKVRGRGVIPV